jgi:hypothetical protein
MFWVVQPVILPLFLGKLHSVADRNQKGETRFITSRPFDSYLLENAKRYAAQNNTTLTDLIKAYLRHIPTQAPLEDAPIVRRLSGILSQDVSVVDYKKHLEEKYVQQAFRYSPTL